MPAAAATAALGGSTAAAVRPTAAMPQVAPSAVSSNVYPSAPARPAAPGHGGHGAARRPSGYDDDYQPRGSRGGGSGGGRGSSTMILVGVVAAVAAIALLAYTMLGGDKGKGGPNNAASTSGSHSSAADSSSPSAATADVAYTSVSLYDSDDGTEGKSYLTNGQIGDKGWFTSQYCQNWATVGGQPKGTGLIFDLGSAKNIATATVTIGTPGAGLEMWAADPSVTSAPAPEKGKPPTGFKQVATASADSTTVTLKASAPVNTRFVLVWFVKPLPPAQSPDKSIKCAHDDGNRYGDSISAVKFNNAS